MVTMIIMKANVSPRSSRSSTRLRDQAEQQSFTATQAKHEFGHLLEKAVQGATIIITKHDAPKAVLMSIEQFSVMTRASELRLGTLSREFDALLERMQDPSRRRAMHAAFTASPLQLGKAAVAAARKRG